MSYPSAFYRLGQFLKATMLPEENQGTLTLMEDYILWQHFGDNIEIRVIVNFGSPILKIWKNNMPFQWNCDAERFQ